GTSYSVSLSYSTTYYWRVSATNSSGTSSWSSRSFNTMDEPLQPPDPPVLNSPGNGVSGISISSTLSWNAAARATSYTLQVATNSSFSNLVINQSGISGTSYSVSLSYSTTYYWRVNAANSAGVSMWSTPFSFSTVNAEVSPWYHPNTGISHSVIIPLDANPTIDGLPLVNGDIIGVFFDSSGTAACAGFEVWTGQGNIAISAAGNDATTPLKDGFTEGEKFQWKIWRKSDSRSFNANALYQPVGALGGMVYSLDTFTANGLSALSGLIGNSMSIQQIPYRSGWNLLSSYVEPRSANLDSIFAACRIDLVLLKNGMQKSYIPSQSINQIGNWIPTQGYQAKFNKAGTFTIKGRMQKPEETPISLASGWSILPYLRSSEMPVVSAFASIKDIIIIVKDQDGKTYLPSVSINQINTMKPGQAYQIKLSQAKTFSYPANSAAATRAGKVLSQLENGTADITANFICPWRNKITGSSQTIIIPLSVNLAVPSAVRLEPGDAVGVFYDSTGVQTCAGYEYWDAINNIAVAAAADDPTTPETDGFRAGDSLRWKIWKQSTGEILNIKPIYSPLGSLNSLVTSSAIFEINGLSAMQSFGLTNVTNRLSSLPETCTLMQNYPNPFNPETTIAYALPFNCQVRLEIYNSNGQLVESLVNKAQQAGTYRVRWNSSTVSGIYFYKLSTIPENSSLKSFTSVKKMILIK
ncbi:MAG TPA: T9SS type A sorting domain-containing protein, partial [bacterium]|nr:T9SS type A sorting domain-containing protein [bacterium]